MSEPALIVHVHDSVNSQLVGHSGCEYTSPPQPRREALALVAVLLGCPPEAIDDHQQTWTQSIAGGRRTITVTTS
jgi:hypothetical protein